MDSNLLTSLLAILNMTTMMPSCPPLTCHHPIDPGLFGKAANGRQSVAYVIGSKQNLSCYYIEYARNPITHLERITETYKIDGESVTETGYLIRTPSNLVHIDFIAPKIFIRHEHTRILDNGVVVEYACNNDSQDEVIKVGYDVKAGDLSQEARHIAGALIDHPDDFQVDFSDC